MKLLSKFILLFINRQHRLTGNFCIMQKLLIAILSSATFITLGILDINKVEAASIINGIGLDNPLDNPTQTITFEEIDLPIGTEITTQYSGLGVTFSNLFLSTPVRRRPVNFNLHHRILSNFDATLSGPFGPFSINFLQQQTAVEFTLLTNTGISTFTALLNGVVIETFDARTILDGRRYGFSGILFDEIRVNPGGSNLAAGIDDLQLSSPTFTSVPETSSVLGLLSMGALSIGFCHKRRQKTTSNLSR